MVAAIGSSWCFFSDTLRLMQSFCLRIISLVWPSLPVVSASFPVFGWLSCFYHHIWKSVKPHNVQIRFDVTFEPGNVMLPNKRLQCGMMRFWAPAGFALFPHGFFKWDGILHFQTPRCLMTWWKKTALLEWNWVHILWNHRPVLEHELITRPAPPLMKTTLHLCQHHSKLLGGFYLTFAACIFWICIYGG